MRNTKKYFAALAVAGVVAISGSAFTAANTVDDSVAGYGTSTVTGATATAVEHSLSTDGESIESTVITFSVDQTGNTVVAGFGTAALEGCTVLTTTATCTYATPYVTADAVAFNVAVS